MEGSVLVVNCGSSSLKLALYNNAEETNPVIEANADRLGTEQASLSVSGEIELQTSGSMDHSAALTTFIKAAEAQLKGLRGIGHRVVHGGESFIQSCTLDQETIVELKKVSGLAPLHNPMNLMGIELCGELLPGVPNVAVFDTAFHQTIPESTYLYAVPYAWYKDYGVRRYGFHGTSYRFVAAETARRLKQSPEDLNLIIAHLGNGCSACAIRQGQSVDTTMGLTPLEGLVMGTRSGDIDPGLIEFMSKAAEQPLDDLMTSLNRESGLLGLSGGLSNDMRTLLEAESEGDEAARRAIDAFCFRTARHLAALSTNFTHTDAVVFTGGIGEHSANIRQRILACWKNIPYRLNSEFNQSNGNETGRISEQGTPLVMVVPTDEERMIAQDTYRLTSDHD
ncbi:MULTISPECIES: acetate/propionate family kinase [Thalassolituus]|uniref:acetate/propionate family kinase n=2 Tax=Oceanospirillaceae TaxID=135620 RepID=UPI000C61C19A|nr:MULTISPECIES: acetate/propionate family kinase [Thalassolituus]MAX86826.1 acetate kinase [Oceanospirillaceae bacterium]|tara:strand:+ start:9462 stop:10646 length:1185 start_codon:yes stop_codon:yes gene_type:complete